jgi:hypothetical protein
MSVLGTTIKFEELVSFIEKNPNKTKQLVNDTNKIKESEDLINLPGKSSNWIYYLVEPSEIVSAYLYLSNDMFIIAPSMSKNNYLLEAKNSLITSINNYKDGKVGRLRKKAIEYMSKTQDKLTKDELMQLWYVLVTIGGFQTILLGKDDIKFVPDINKWNKNKKFYILTDDLTRVWKPFGNFINNLGLWLEDIEKKYTIEWPEFEGTKTEMVEWYSVRPDWKSEYNKLKKEELSKKIGRLQVFEFLSS